MIFSLPFLFPATLIRVLNSTAFHIVIGIKHNHRTLTLSIKWLHISNLQSCFLREGPKLNCLGMVITLI
jgi:hypothetical protein